MNCLSKTFQGKIVKFAATTKNSVVKFYNTNKLPFKIITVNLKMSISLSFQPYPYKTLIRKNFTFLSTQIYNSHKYHVTRTKYIPIIYPKLIVFYHYDYISPYLLAILSMRKSGQKKLI